MNESNGIWRGLELVEGLGLEEIRVRLDGVVDVEKGAKRALAFYLADVSARRLHEDGGYRSVAHFAEGHLEIVQRRARELIQIGNELRGLELVDASLIGGELSWSKMLLLLGVVQRGTQVEWIEFAREVSCRELQDETRRCRPGELPGQGTRISIDPTGSKTIEVTVKDWTYSNIERIRQHLLERSGRAELSDSDVLEALVAKFIEQEPELQEDEDFDSLAVSPDSDTYDELSAPNHDPLEPAVRQDVLTRDGFACQACSSPQSPHVHHIEHRKAGGDNSPHNLVTLCPACHGLVHRDKLRIVFTPRSPQPPDVHIRRRHAPPPPTHPAADVRRAPTPNSCREHMTPP